MFGLSSAKHMQSAARSDQKSWSSQTVAKIPKYLAIIACLSALILGYQQITSPDNFPIRHVQIIDPQQRIDHQIIQNLVMPEVVQGFFHVDVQHIQQIVGQMPWVESALIKREWPDKVVISISDKQPQAHWNGQTLISNTGELFTPAESSIPKGLPQLFGARGTHAIALKDYQQMQKQLDTVGLQITRLRISERQGVLLQLNHQFTVNLGEQQQEARLQQFIKVYPQIFAKKLTNLKSVNMQYHHGMAVEWQGA